MKKNRPYRKLFWTRTSAENADFLLFYQRKSAFICVRQKDFDLFPITSNIYRSTVVERHPTAINVSRIANPTYDTLQRKVALILTNHPRIFHEFTNLRLSFKYSRLYSRAVWAKCDSAFVSCAGMPERRSRSVEGIKIEPQRRGDTELLILRASESPWFSLEDGLNS